MNAIIIGFSKPRSNTAVLAHIIRLVEGKTPYSHVYIKWHSEELNRDLIYEARGGGVNFTNKKTFRGKNIVVKEFKLKITDKQKKEIIQFCIDNARTEYGYLQVLGIGLVRLAAKFGKKIQNPFKGGNICSELAAKVLQILGKKVTEDLDSVGPRYIYEVLKNGKN